MKETVQVGKWKEKPIFEKECFRNWILRKVAHAEVGAPQGKGCYWDEHELVQPSSGEVIACPQWEWADLDGKRLVWASEGRLEAGKLTAEGLVDTTLLHDFNEMTFAPIEAPY
jgi:hypothetical protein